MAYGAVTMPTRLLLIDDRPADLLALAEALKVRLEETVADTASSGDEALGLLRDNDYHAVLSDIRMAGLDGFALLVEVRERWPDTPVILMTAAGFEREADALSSGAFAFVEKPLDLDRLVTVLKAALEKAQFQQRIRIANRESVLGLTVDPRLDWSA
jgi:two-component system response regulator GlrR